MEIRKIEGYNPGLAWHHLSKIVYFLEHGPSREPTQDTYFNGYLFREQVKKYERFKHLCKCREKKLRDLRDLKGSVDARVETVLELMRENMPIDVLEKAVKLIGEAGEANEKYDQAVRLFYERTKGNDGFQDQQGVCFSCRVNKKRK